MLGLQSMCWLIVYLAIQPSAALSSVECQLGWGGLSCWENNPLPKILIGVGVVVGVIVVVALLSCCICALCKTESHRRDVIHTAPTTVMPMAYGQPVAMYPGYNAYQPVPLQMSPAQLAMTAAPCANAYPPAGQAHPPSYMEAAPGGQPVHHPMGQPSYIPNGSVNDNPNFVNPEQHKV